MSATQSGAGGIGDLLADCSARGLAGLATLQESRSCLKNQSLHLRCLTVEHLGDLDVAEVADLGEHERRALLLREVVHVGE